MTNLNEETIVNNRLNAINELHTYLNKVVPILMKDIETNGIKVKVNDELFTKDKERLDKLFRDIAPVNVRCYLRYHSYSGVSLCTDTHYKTSEYEGGGFGVAYYKQDIYLTSDSLVPRPFYDDLPIYDVAKELATLPQIKMLQDEIQSKQGELNKLTYLLIGR